MFFNRKRDREEHEEMERRVREGEERHQKQVDERIDRIEAEVRALSAYVGVLPDLRKVVNE